MKRMLLLPFAVLCVAASRPDLHGRVMTEDGKPIAGATAYIYTAGVKVGSSPYCPSCYADCGKSAGTNADGTFTIASLDPELMFRVLFVADGYKPVFVTKVDPASGQPVEAKLSSMPKQLDPARTLSGRVVGPDAKPVVGAIVTPEGCRTAERRWWGSMPGVDPMSITNSCGEFVITADKPAIAYDVRVEARGLAKKNFALLPLGATSHELRLGKGATLIGRLLKDGKPLAGVDVGLVQDARGVEDFTGPRTIGTDAEGRFTFLDVAPAGEWNVYGIAKSLAPHGSVKIETIRVEGDNTTADTGDLIVGPSYTLGGRMILSDGKPVPAGTRLIIGREKAWDSQTVTLDANGRFTINGVPAEEIHVSVSVKGYRFSNQNKSLDLLNLGGLQGMIDADISDLTILLQPGERQRLDYRHFSEQAEKFNELRKTRIEGVSPAR